MAEAADIQVALHCPLGPIAFAACVQLDMSVHNAINQAQNLDIHDPTNNEHLAYLEDPTVFDFKNGYVTPPDGPGLGIDIDEEYVRRQSQTELDWQNPIWYHHDGSIAEW
jgi:galactonate dehydratase